MSVNEVVNSFFEAAENADVEGLRRLYAPDATIWHNDGAGDQSVDENLESLAVLFGGMLSVKFEVKRRVEVPGGVFQTHTLHGVLPNGERVDLDAAMFMQVDAGQVSRIEEYFDVSTVTAMFAATAAVAG
ncbi:nuclear transport factor 2 family protein [Rhodococcus sp. ACPA1]|uniref:nuclear transport factor 2 family protein n=1 Tax=Rhodococcus sp. ACPA1 TaxID=2028572 RepID=UPI001C534090|nr:nuclear transport factor 2 family protein [Rhodococcus sp. ACPA1]